MAHMTYSFIFSYPQQVGGATKSGGFCLSSTSSVQSPWDGAGGA